MTETDSASANGSHSALQADAYWMNRAIEIARRGMMAGEPPIGACLVIDGQAVATLHNSIIGELDITAHAEMRVIREACKTRRSLDLAGAALYVTVEPCRMCLAACHYAGIEAVIFGAPIEAIDEITGVEIRTETSATSASGRLKSIRGGCQLSDCLALIEAWSVERKSPADKLVPRQ